jgi:hypothetical protein
MAGVRRLYDPAFAIIGHSSSRSWNKSVIGIHVRGSSVFRLAVVRPVAKTALTPGTVVWAHIPYHETDGWKLRPVVVSHTSGREVVVFRGTTAHTRFRYPWSYRELTDLDSAGLHRATGIYIESATIDLIDIVSVAGLLGPDDWAAVIGGEADLARSSLEVAA